VDSSGSWIDWLTISGHPRWLWLLPAVAIPILVRGFFLLQLLSAELLFTALFITCAILAVLFLAMLFIVGCAFEPIVVVLVAAARHLWLSVPESVDLCCRLYIFTAGILRHGLKDKP
jgi:hypothetical protein